MLPRVLFALLILVGLPAQAGHTPSYPTADFNLLIEGYPPQYHTVQGQQEYRPVRANWTWGVMPVAKGPCLDPGAPAPHWFKNGTALRMLVVPNYDAKGDPIFSPDGDQQYLAVFERFTQTGQTIEVVDGCRRAIAQIEHEVTYNPLGSTHQFPPLLNLQGGPLGPIHLRVRVQQRYWERPTEGPNDW